MDPWNALVTSLFVLCWLHGSPSAMPLKTPTPLPLTLLVGALMLPNPPMFPWHLRSTATLSLVTVSSGWVEMKRTCTSKDIQYLPSRYHVAPCHLQNFFSYCLHYHHNQIGNGLALHNCFSLDITGNIQSVEIGSWQGL